MRGVQGHAVRAGGMGDRVMVSWGKYKLPHLTRNLGFTGYVTACCEMARDLIYIFRRLCELLGGEWNRGAEWKQSGVIAIVQLRDGGRFAQVETVARAMSGNTHSSVYWHTQGPHPVTGQDKL